MKNIYYKNRQNFEEVRQKIQNGGKERLHIVADFDRTLTKHFIDGEKRPSLISVLRREGYLGEEYTKKAYALFDLYNPIEIDPNYPIEKKKEKMQEWWQAHLQLIVDSHLHEDIIKKVATSGIMILRDGMKPFLQKLYTDNIPLVIISANGLGLDSIRLYLEYENSLYNNIHVVGNQFEFNSEGFEYNNLLKIGFLNDNEDKLLEKYLEVYDVVLTGDTDISFLETLKIF